MKSPSFSGWFCLGLISLVFHNFVVNAAETLEEKMKNDPDISQVNKISHRELWSRLLLHFNNIESYLYYWRFKNLFYRCSMLRKCILNTQLGNAQEVPFKVF